MYACSTMCKYRIMSNVNTYKSYKAPPKTSEHISYMKSRFEFAKL